MSKKIIKVGELETKADLSEKVRVSPRSGMRRLALEEGGVISKTTLIARQKGETLITEAEEEAARIRLAAEKVLSDVQDVAEKARQQGFAEGRADGLATLAELAVKFQKMREDFYQNAEADIIRLVMAIAEQVIGKIVHDHSEAIRSVVRQAIEAALGERITVRVNPEDLSRVQKEDVAELLDRTQRLIFKGDETISQGGCVVETEVGTIDARLETQLKAIRKALDL